MTSPDPTRHPSPAGDRPRTVHVVVGPDEHSVVQHGVLVARACGDRLVRLLHPSAGPKVDLGDAELVHLPFADRLFGERTEDSAVAWDALVGPWVTAGRALSTTLHDLPEGTSARDRRRRSTYTAVVSRCSGVVVSSWLELELLARLDGGAARVRSLRCIPLPVDPPLVAAARDPAPTAREVVVLGFVFPDRGYEHTIDELPDGVSLRALGRPADGHDDLPSQLADRARRRGRAMTTTGFIPHGDLGAALTAAGVPVAPNRRVTASGSINTWTAHGRRPLVPDSPYARELELRAPGRISLYDADRPGSLHRSVEAALAEPQRTWLDAGVTLGPTAQEVGRRYLEHFAAAVAPGPIALGSSRWVVPANRWDLLDGWTSGGSVPPPTVSVVVPYFEAQGRLDLVLTALSLQSHPRERLQVVVADDGSSTPPDLGAGQGLRCEVVRQSRAGFRAAAARNLGAAAASGEVVAFLDGDTLPEPDYLARLCRLPALLSDAFTVGRRRHADFTGWTPALVRRWLTGAGETPTELTEPAWLTDAYTASNDLLTVDPRSYRYVISAVMALSRDLFVEVGGFDERFRSYGGEDWELAHRAYAAGAVLAHVSSAVAWHDGPDFAGRAAGGADGGAGSATASKNEESLTLARLLPDPVARGGGSWARPAIVVELGFADPVEVLATSRAAFSGDTDCAVWVVHPDAATTVDLLDDPRIRAGAPPAEVLASAAALVHLEAPARLTGLSGLAILADVHGTVGLPTGTVTSRRTARRADRWAGALETSPSLLAARLFGGLDVAHPVPSRPVDLAHELTALERLHHP